MCTFYSILRHIWCFRHYPVSETYLGVVCVDSGALPFEHVYAVVGTDVFELGHIDNYLSLIDDPDDSDCGPPVAGGSSGGDTSGDDSSNGGSTNGDASGGNACVNIPFDAHEGITETLLINSSTSQGSTSMTQINEYLSVTNSKAVTKVTIKNLAGVVDSEATDTEYYDIKSDYLWPTAFKTELELIQTFEGMSFELLTTIESTFEPSYKAHPVNEICEGDTWTASAYTETSKTTISVPGFSVPGFTPPPVTESSSMPGYTGIVQSVNDSQTVPAGTFETVRIKYNYNNEFEMTTWITTDIGALVKMEMSGSSDGQAFRSTTELMEQQD